MKNHLLFYFLVFLPLPLLYFISDNYGSTIFVAALIFYSFIYRPVIDYHRLSALNAIGNKKWWKFFIPFYYYWHKDILFFGK
ncbi:MAG: hypothetical protein ACNS60_18870 [Candidatus Cyclobacteriaceae bacterium M2_1C_046]